MTIETLHSDYADPDAPEGTIGRSIADIIAKDAEFAEVGLDLPEDMRRRFGKLVAFAEFFADVNLEPHTSSNISLAPDEKHPYLRGESERTYVDREPDYLHDTTMGATDLSLAA